MASNAARRKRKRRRQRVQLQFGSQLGRAVFLYAPTVAMRAGRAAVNPKARANPRSLITAAARLGVVVHPTLEGMDEDPDRLEKAHRLIPKIHARLDEMAERAGSSLSAPDPEEQGGAP